MRGIAGVYTVRNDATGQMYIGSTRNIRDRWAEHIKHLVANVHINPFLQASFTYYGISSFSFKIVELVDDKEERLAQEQYWLTWHAHYYPGQLFNISLFVKQADVNKDPRMIARMVKPKTAEHRAKIALGQAAAWARDTGNRRRALAERNRTTKYERD